MATRRCEVCGALLRIGTRCPGCLGLPSPAEIAQCAAEIRSGWSSAETEKRSGCHQQHVVASEFRDPEYRKW